jgi:hypothetical protein
MAPNIVTFLPHIVSNMHMQYCEICCRVIKYLLTYQASKLFRLVDQRPRPNNTTGLSETAECTTTYATTQQGTVNSSNFYNNINHNLQKVFGNSKLSNSLCDRQSYGIYTCLCTYIRKRSIKVVQLLTFEAIIAQLFTYVLYS